MARIPVWIVHDELGQIISIARPAEGVKAIISGEGGQSVLQTEVEEDSIVELVGGSHRVNIEQKSVVAYTEPPLSE